MSKRRIMIFAVFEGLPGFFDGVIRRNPLTKAAIGRLAHILIKSRRLIVDFILSL